MLWIPPDPSQNLVGIIPCIEAKGSYYIWRPSSLHTTVQYYLYYPIQTRYLVSQSFGVESSRPHNLLGWKKKVYPVLDCPFEGDPTTALPASSHYYVKKTGSCGQQIIKRQHF